MADEDDSFNLDAAGHEKVNEKNEKMCKLPLTRIKFIMKMDPDVCLASQESVFLIGKATELFIQELTKEAFVFTSQSKKKTLQKNDVDQAIESVDNFVFLEGALDWQ
ncbi:DNA polymerase epsilon subunit 4 [Chamberlinius hualienensis]